MKRKSILINRQSLEKGLLLSAAVLSLVWILIDTFLLFFLDEIGAVAFFLRMRHPELTYYTLSIGVSSMRMTPAIGCLLICSVFQMK